MGNFYTFSVSQNNYILLLWQEKEFCKKTIASIYSSFIAGRNSIVLQERDNGQGEVGSYI
jgi:hypothetical protein